MTVRGPQVPDDPREVMRSIDENDNVVFGRVGINEIDSSGRFGATAYSTSSNSVSIGDKTFTLDQDDGKFKIGDDILIVAKDDPTNCYMWAEITNSAFTPGPLTLTVYVEDVSAVTGTFANWELQVVARPKIGIEKDISTTSVAFAAVGSTMTFTVTANKFFPIRSKVLIKAKTSPTAIAIGSVKAYNGTTLIVEITAKTTAATGTFSSWGIGLLDAPQDKIPLYQINGLRITINATDPAHDIDIQPGSVRDSTDTIDLILSSFTTKRLDASFVAGTNQGAYVQTSNLTGTISSAVLNVTGTGTTFLSDLGTDFNGGTLSDYTSQYTAWTGSAPAQRACIISAGAVTTTIHPTSNTAATTLSALGAGAGTSYKRGGWTVDQATYGICLGRKDSDGSTAIFATSFTSSGNPDIPSGYTYYRLIGIVTTGFTDLIIEQPLHAMRKTQALEVVVDDANFTLYSGITDLQTMLDSIDTQDTSDSDRLTVLETVTANLGSGTYTPTLSNTTNVAASTPQVTSYYRVGNVVTVAGMCNIDPTAAAPTNTVLGISLPIASNFTNIVHCAGFGAQVTAGAQNELGVIVADTVNDRAELRFQAVNAANHTYAFNFTYLVL